ncbi:MAG: 3,4-dihydroxy-2-butanone-4-phosphate synthase [Solirubrobacterales bacterium]
MDEAIRRHLREAFAATAPVALVGPEPTDPGYLMLAAERSRPEPIRRLSKAAGGWICLALTADRCAALGLEPISADPTGRLTFTSTFEAEGDQRGSISYAAQAASIAAATGSRVDPGSIHTPGNMQALMALEGGVLRRSGPAETATDLAAELGLEAAVVVAEILDDHGRSVPSSQLRRREHTRVEVADVAAARLREKPILRRVAAARMPTRFGEFTAIGFEAPGLSPGPVALVMGDVRGAEAVPVRVQRRCVLGEALHSKACRCDAELERALTAIARRGSGAVIHVDGAAGARSSLVGAPEPHQACADPAARWREDVAIAEVIADLSLASVALDSGSPSRPARLTRLGVPLEQGR